MKGKLRYVLIAIAVIVVIVIALPFLISVNQFRPTIEEKLSTALGRQVQVGNLSLSILSGSLGADDLSIADDPAFGKSAFLTAKSLRVGVELMPLIFSRALHVTGVTIDKPEVTLIKNPAGRWNFSSLASGSSSKSAAPASSSSSAGASDLVIGKIDMKNGSLILGSTNSHQAHHLRRSQFRSHQCVARKLVSTEALGQITRRRRTQARRNSRTSRRKRCRAESGRSQAKSRRFRSRKKRLRRSSFGFGRRRRIEFHSFLEERSGECARHSENYEAPSRKGWSAICDACGSRFRDRVRHAQKHRSSKFRNSENRQGHFAYFRHLRSQRRSRDPEHENKRSRHAGAGPRGHSSGIGRRTSEGRFAPKRHIKHESRRQRTRKQAGHYRKHQSSECKAGRLRSRLQDGGALRVFECRKERGHQSIQKLTSDVRVAPEGIQTTNMDLVMPSIGEMTGGGTVGTDSSLNFKMRASVNGVGGLLGGTSGGKTTIPFAIQGTTSDPKFIPDVAGMAGALGSQLGSSLQGGQGTQGVANTLGGLLGKKKKPNQKSEPHELLQSDSLSPVGAQLAAPSDDLTVKSNPGATAEVPFATSSARRRKSLSPSSA